MRSAGPICVQAPFPASCPVHIDGPPLFVVPNLVPASLYPPPSDAPTPAPAALCPPPAAVPTLVPVAPYPLLAVVSTALPSPVPAARYRSPCASRPRVDGHDHVLSLFPDPSPSPLADVPCSHQLVVHSRVPYTCHLHDGHSTGLRAVAEVANGTDLPASQGRTNPQAEVPWTVAGSVVDSHDGLARTGRALVDMLRVEGVDANI